MFHLRLWLLHTDTFYLDRTEFRSLGQPQHRVHLIATRGGSTGRSFTGRGFGWTSAIRALTILLLQHAASDLEAPASPETPLSGETGSPAASLDFALAKQPIWLQDIFGLTESGLLQARRLFPRLNSERKRAGPVVISVNRQLLPPNSVEIFVDGEPIEDVNSLLAIAKAITNEWKKSNHVRRTDPLGIPFPVKCRVAGPNTNSNTSVSNKTFELSWLRELNKAYCREAQMMLNATDIFTPSSFRELKRSATQSSSFLKVAGRRGLELNKVDSELIGAARFGGDSSDNRTASLLRDGPCIEVALSPAHSGSLVILTYLQHEMNIPIRINLVAHSVEMAKRMLTGDFASPPDLCSLTIATAGAVCGKGLGKAYSPYMFMPRMSHGVLSSHTEIRQPPSDSGVFLFMKEIPSSEAFCFDDLVTSGTLKKRTASVHAEPDEVAYKLRQGDPEVKAIIGFPYYVFNALFHGSKLLNDPYAPCSLKETVFFSSANFATMPLRAKALKLLIRDAWLDLAQSPSMIQMQVDRLTALPHFVKFLSRCLGASNIPKSSQFYSGQSSIATFMTSGQA